MGRGEHHVEDLSAAGPEPEKKSLHASEQTRPDVAQARAAWQASQPDTPVSRLVFLDETWASTDMTPTRGRSAIGKRCSGRAPYGHWKTTTFVCALRCAPQDWSHRWYWMARSMAWPSGRG